MIYPWYDEERWLSERFTEDPAKGAAILEEYGPPPAEIHFRHSYASFRVKGLEYARLSRTGKVRYGIKHAPLDADKVPPSLLVKVLSEMFCRLADTNGNASALPPWTEAITPPSLQHFIRHVSVQHQAEHWLESELLQDPRALCEAYDQARSQVVIAERIGAWNGFIDLLALDKRSLELIVVELKVVPATLQHVEQVREYYEWAERHLDELLDPSKGYFHDVVDPGRYRVRALLVSTAFDPHVLEYVDAVFPDSPVRIVTISSSWRKNLVVEQVAFRGGESSKTDGAKLGVNNEEGSLEPAVAHFFASRHEEDRRLWKDVVETWQRDGWIVRPGTKGLSFKALHGGKEQAMFWTRGRGWLWVLLDHLARYTFLSNDAVGRLRNRLLRIPSVREARTQLKIRVSEQSRSDIEKLLAELSEFVATEF